MNGQQQITVQLVPHLVGERYFTVPKIGKTIDETRITTHLTPLEVTKVQSKGQKQMRYVGYIRISSEEQVGNFSVDAQRRAIETWVKAQDGKLTNLYIDEAETGKSASRAAFLEMRRDASKGKFDALVVHKFDRFARSRTDSLAIKSLLRRDYGIKVYSVTEPSEDSDGAIGALIEGIMECVAEWYSRNLSEETTKGKHERALQGYHNNQAPFGYDKNEKKILIPNDHECEGLLLAFELYDTGTYSDNQVAKELNARGYRSKTGKPFSTDTVRDMLQNRTYLGYVKYQKFAQHSDGRRSWANQTDWIKGKHQAIIPEALFDRCQEIRQAKAVHREYYPKYRVYLLRDLVYCAECTSNMPDDTDDPTYGKMRPQSQNHRLDSHLYYRCRARDLGRRCSQSSVRAEFVEKQVIDVLKQLKPPADWRDRIVEAMGELLGDQRLEERITEIKGVIDRMDFRWDQGFITDKDAYLEERVKLQQELEQLTPIPDDELQQAAEILENFSEHWQNTNGDRKAQQALIHLIVARVWVKDYQVVAMSLRPNYHITLGLESEKPTSMSVGSPEDITDSDISIPRRERRELGTRVYTPHPALLHHGSHYGAYFSTLVSIYPRIDYKNQLETTSTIPCSLSFTGRHACMPQEAKPCHHPASGCAAVPAKS